MDKTKLQQSLERGEPVPSFFTPAGEGLETPGVLTWSVERGADLELVDLSDPWPADFDQEFTVHGWPNSGEPLTLLKTHVRTTTFVDRASRLNSWSLALGEHVEVDRCWPIANYRPSALHEWLPETGLSLDYPSEGFSRLVLEWNRPETRTVQLPDAQLRIQPGARSHGVRFHIYGGWNREPVGSGDGELLAVACRPPE